jgi:N-acyl-D-amino-acid deacylase
MLDLAIKNGNLVDGTGRAPYEAELGISDGRIVLVEKTVDQKPSEPSMRRPPGRPGFIDPHTHSELALLANPRAESKIRQGVTTEIVGNCGGSPGPLLGAAMEEEVASAKAFGVEVDWTTLGGYLERVARQGCALNVAALVGHNTVRGSVLGLEDVQPTPEQQAEMSAWSRGHAAGSLWLSTGLPIRLASSRTEEVIDLAKAAAEHGGIYASHIRSETDHLLEAVEEAIEIGANAGIKVQVSHIKLEGFRNWGGIEQLVGLLEDAASRGIHLRCDQYPYTAGASWLAYILPYWAQAGGAQGRRSIARSGSDAPTA